MTLFAAGSLPPLTALLLAAAALGGCAKHNSSSSAAAGRPLPFGLYDVTAPVCLSTNAAPAYPGANFQAALFDFSALTAHTLQVAASAVETFTAANCTVTVTRSLLQDSGGTYTLRRDRKHVFAPDGCDLQVTWQDHVYAVGPTYGTLFTDSDDLRPEVPYDVSVADGVYTLTSQDLPDLDALWGSYGCAKPDRVKSALTPRSP